MTKQLNKNIKYLKNALKEIKSIDIEDYTLERGLTVQSMKLTFNNRLTEAQFQLEVILNDLEEKYHEIHNMRSYHD